MLDTAVEKVIAEIDQLSSEQQKEVFEHLEKKVNGKRLHGSIITPKTAGEDSAKNRLKPAEFPITPRIIGTYEPEDRTKEHEWLHMHSDEYAGQWVALSGDRLISHGYALKEVMEKVEQEGITNALVVRAEASDALPFAGF
jgi:Family of unknown function (DUF5678)